jgi:hypothetical protein
VVTPELSSEVGICTIFVSDHTYLPNTCLNLTLRKFNTIQARTRILGGGDFCTLELHATLCTFICINGSVICKIFPEFFLRGFHFHNGMLEREKEREKGEEAGAQGRRRENKEKRLSRPRAPLPINDRLHHKTFSNIKNQMKENSLL